ncbi:phage tail tape measure protein [Staphylococcus auricularis]|uniref:phage tail tape measure protein n=1 Tax=Staphylococcus auricularis TaxID=29379 RepID=UPI002DBCEDBC|nr:phage tail tape measure protein [Staphylococcus auricularis]MEB6569084.1 phage tail tape measure protein [Staphylococcus auricularis]
MAEQYEGVTIKLGLNTANIDRGMQALSRKMKTLNSEMKSHLSAFDMAEKSSDKYNGKIKILNKQLETQGQKVASAENKLKSLKDEQTKANEKIAESSQKLKAEKATLDTLNQTLSRHNSKLNQTKAAYDKADADLKRYKSDLDLLKAKHQEAGASVKTLKNKLTELTNSNKQNTAEFKRTQAQLNVVESEYKQLGAEVDKADLKYRSQKKTVEETKQAHQKMSQTVDKETQQLKVDIKEQEKVVNGAEQAHQKLQKRISGLPASIDKAERAVHQEKATFNSLQRQLKNTEAEYERYKQENSRTAQVTNRAKEAISALTTQLKRSLNQFKATGSSVSSYQTRINDLKNAHTQLKNNIAMLNHEHRRLSGEQGRNSEAARQLADKINVEKIKMNELSGEIKRTEGSLKQFEREQKIAASLSATPAGRAVQSINKYQDKLRDASNTMKAVGRTSMIYMTAPIVAGMGGAVKASIDWEDALTGVAKTTDMTGKELSQMGDKITDMSNKMPFAANEIAGVAEAAGQLGVKKSSILDFTKTMMDLSVATNMTADEAATQFAKFANAAGMPIDNVDRLGSAVVNLGNNTATTEKDIVNMGQRLAGAGAQAGFSADEIMSIAAAMSSVGIEAEAGGTAMTQIFNKMTKAAASGGDELKGFAETSGMSAEQFAQTWENNPTKALSAFVKGLGNTKGGAKGVQKALEQVGISGIREADTVRRMANNHKVLDDALKVGSEGWKENNALTNEAQQRYDTLKSKLIVLKNNFVNFGREIGATLEPILSPIISKLSDVFKGFQGASKGTKLFVVGLGGLAAVLPPIILLAGGFAGALLNITKVLTGIPKMASVFSVLTNPIGIAVAAIAALGTAFVIAYKKSETFRNIVHTVIDPVIEGVKRLWGNIKLLFQGIKNLYQGNDDLGGKLLNKLFPPGVVEAISNTIDFIKEKFTVVFGAVSDFAHKIGETLSTFWEENGTQIIEALTNIKNFIQPIIEAIKNIIVGAANIIKSIVVGAMMIIWNIMKSIWPAIELLIKSVWGNIKGIISGALDIILGTVKIFSTLFTGDWKGLWNSIVQVLKGIVQVIWNLVQLWFVGKILKLFKVFGKLVAGVFRGLWKQVVSIFIKMKDSVVRIATAIKNGVLKAFTAIKNTTVKLFTIVKNFLIKVWTTIKNKVVNLAQRLRNEIKKIWHTLKTVTIKLFTTIKNFLIKIWTTIKNKVVNLVRRLWNGIKKVWHTLKTVTIKLFTSVKNFLVKIWTTIKNRVVLVVKKLWNGIRRVWLNLTKGSRKIFNKFKAYFINLWEKIKSTVIDIVSKLWNRVKRIFNNMKDGLKGIIDKIKGHIGGMVKAIKKGLNGLIKGLNWVGDKLNLPKIPKLSKGTQKINRKIRTTHDGKLKSGTMATVGDKGRGNGKGRDGRRELIQYPNGRTVITPAKDTHTYLPKGSRVVNGKQRQSVEGAPFSTGTLPRFSKGSWFGKTKDWVGDKVSNIGSAIGNGAKMLADKVGDVMDYVEHPGKLLDKVLSTLGVDFKSITKGMGMVGEITRAAWKRIKKAAIQWIKDGFDSMAGDGSVFDGYDILQRYSAPPKPPNPNYPFNGGVHHGVDYDMPVGTDVRTPMSGKVKNWYDSYGGGNSVTVAKGKTYLWFMHLSKQLKKTGEQVKAGQLIGKSGNTGSLTNYRHLHFQVNQGGEANKYSTDPIPWLKKHDKTGGGKRKPSEWRSTIEKAAKRMKVSPSEAQINGIIAQIQRESGGDPGITQGNIGDINNRNGTPAQGLLQFVPATFKSFAVKGHTNINSGYDQLLAFFNNSNWANDIQYGNSGWGPRGHRRFATGGLIRQPGFYQLAEQKWPEWVIPTDPKRRTDAQKLLALAGKDIMSGKRNRRPSHFNSSSVKYNETDRKDNKMIEIMAQQLRETQKQVELLTRLVASNQRLENKPNGFNERDVSQAQGDRYRLDAYSLGGI